MAATGWVGVPRRQRDGGRRRNAVHSPWWCEGDRRFRWLEKSRRGSRQYGNLQEPLLRWGKAWVLGSMEIGDRVLEGSYYLKIGNPCRLVGLRWEDVVGSVGSVRLL